MHAERKGAMNVFGDCQLAASLEVWMNMHGWAEGPRCHTKQRLVLLNHSQIQLFIDLIIYRFNYSLAGCWHGSRDEHRRPLEPSEGIPNKKIK